MADNTGEEHLNNPADAQPESLPKEIVPAQDTETINPRQQTKNIEVHHHPDLHHEKKNFREYLLEFLMIFLAVTMGFFCRKPYKLSGKRYFSIKIDDQFQ